MNLKDNKYLVVGAGISGISAVGLLDEIGASGTILFDGNQSADRSAILKRINEKKTLKHDVEIIIGDIDDEKLNEVDIAILSPGVPLDNPLSIRIKEHYIPIWGELELGYKTGKGRVVAITGTNGKTTTTSLVGAIMREQYSETYVVGNIGLPYTEYTLSMTDESMTVAEVSSFQLETIQDFCPVVSAILNITPDHLDRHHTMEAYIDAKFCVTKNQGKDLVCVLNYEDELIRERIPYVKAKVVFFSSKTELTAGVYLKGEDILYKESEDKEAVKVCTIHDMNLLGVHNYENVMAAIAITANAGVSLDNIRKAIREFEAVEHRIEYVKTVKGVKYYNDSKGTNTDASIKAVEAMVTPTVLIGGGYDKHSEYDEWIDSFKDKVKELVLIGETADKIEETARKKGFINITRCDTLEEAVLVCHKLACEGWAVLLSPACASWDMFKSYEERGRLFKEYVNKLSE